MEEGGGGVVRLELEKWKMRLRKSETPGDNLQHLQVGLFSRVFIHVCIAIFVRSYPLPELIQEILFLLF